MKSIHIEATYNTPKVDFDPATGDLKFYGISIPEHGNMFYFPIVKWLDEYSMTYPPKINLSIMLDYINSSSVKYFMDVFEKLESIKKNGSEVAVEWYYESDDEEMRDVGEEYEEALDLKFKYIALDEFE